MWYSSTCVSCVGNTGNTLYPPRTIFKEHKNKIHASEHFTKYPNNEYLAIDSLLLCVRAKQSENKVKHDNLVLRVAHLPIVFVMIKYVYFVQSIH